MMDNQGDGDLQPVFQFSVDLAQGHISVRHNAMTRVTKQKVQRVGSCAPIKLLASVRHIIVLLGENSSQRIYSFSLWNGFVAAQVEVSEWSQCPLKAELSNIYIQHVFLIFFYF